MAGQAFKKKAKKKQKKKGGGDSKKKEEQIEVPDISSTLDQIDNAIKKSKTKAKQEKKQRRRHTYGCCF